MARTTVNVNEDLLFAARAKLGTRGISDTVNAALAAIARDAILHEFDVRGFGITDEELAVARSDRLRT